MIVKFNKGMSGVVAGGVFLNVSEKRYVNFEIIPIVDPVPDKPCEFILRNEDTYEMYQSSNGKCKIGNFEFTICGGEEEADRFDGMNTPIIVFINEIKEDDKKIRVKN